MPIHKAEADWHGNFDDGEGKMRLGSGAFEGAYSYRSRMEGSAPGTNPEELLGAAHAGCFSMSLARRLSADGHPTERIHTEARVRLGREGRATPSAGSTCARRRRCRASRRGCSWRRPRRPSATARSPRRSPVWRRSPWRPDW